MEYGCEVFKKDKQSRDYTKLIKKYNLKSTNILPVYLQLNELINLDFVVKAGYIPFLRNDFLTILDDYKGHHSILKSFETYCQNIEEETASYKKLSINSWSNFAWIGFYNALNDYRCIGFEEGYLINKSSPKKKAFPKYTALFNIKKKGCKIYVQLRKQKLHIKIKQTGVDLQETNPNLLAQHWGALIEGYDFGNGLVIEVPAHQNPSRAMVIGTIENYIATENNLVSIHKTIQNLRDIEDYLSKIQI